jgi:pilus assembly protein CpaE
VRVVLAQPKPGGAALKVILVCEKTAERAEVRKALSALSDPKLEIEETGIGTTAGSGAACDLAMVIFDGNEEGALAYLERQRQTKLDRRPALFALLCERSPELMRRVLRAGADEVLFLPLDVGDATRALLKLSEARRRLERASGGIVCSFVSMVGGVGVSTLSVNLALALRRIFDKRVAVVDLDLQTGALAPMLNLEPDHTIMALMGSGRRLDSIQLEAALTRHDSGLYLLAAPKKIEECELVSEAVIATVLDVMRQLFDFVAVDCGGYINESVVAAWENSDRLFYLLDQSIGAAHRAWRFMELFKRLGISSLAPEFVLSRYRSSHPISEEQLAHTLGQPFSARIVRDDRLLERLQLNGKDLWQEAPGAPLTKNIEELARRIAPGPQAGESQARAGLVGRLLAAVAARG